MKKLGWVRHVELRTKEKCMQKVGWKTSWEKSSHLKEARIWKSSVKMDLRITSCRDVDWKISSIVALCPGTGDVSALYQLQTLVICFCRSIPTFF
jgi:hypothetical protein